MKDKLIIFIATGTYLGKFPYAPGTVGTLWGIPLAYGVSLLSPYLGVAVLLVFTIFSVYISNEAIRILGSGDPKEVVIDEIIGYAIGFFLLDFTAVNIILVFILFRFFDIVKPFPVNTAEKRLPGGWGVVMDDCVAGIYANLLANLILFISFAGTGV